MKRSLCLLLLLTLFICTACGRRSIVPDPETTPTGAVRVPEAAASDLMTIYNEFSAEYPSPVFVYKWEPTYPKLEEDYHILLRGGFVTKYDLDEDGTPELIFGEKRNDMQDSVSYMLVTSIFTIRDGKLYYDSQCAPRRDGPHTVAGVTEIYRYGVLLYTELPVGETSDHWVDEQYCRPHSFITLWDGVVYRKISVKPYFPEDGSPVYHIIVNDEFGRVADDKIITWEEYLTLCSNEVDFNQWQPDWRLIQRSDPEIVTVTHAVQEKNALEKEWDAKWLAKAQAHYDAAKEGAYPFVQGEPPAGHSFVALYDLDGDGAQDLLIGYRRPEGERLLIDKIYLMRDGRLTLPPEIGSIDPDVFTDRTVVYENGVLVVTAYAMGEHSNAEEYYYRVIDGQFCQIAAFGFNEEAQKDYYYCGQIVPYVADVFPYYDCKFQKIPSKAYPKLVDELIGGNDPVRLPWQLIKEATN